MDARVKHISAIIVPQAKKTYFQQSWHSQLPAAADSNTYTHTKQQQLASSGNQRCPHSPRFTKEKSNPLVHLTFFLASFPPVLPFLTWTQTRPDLLYRRRRRRLSVPSSLSLFVSGQSGLSAATTTTKY